MERVQCGRLGALMLMLALTACGGGGGGSSGSPSPTQQPPSAPVITLSADSLLQGQILSASATATDPQDSAITFQWEFGDSATASGAEVQHEYAVDGTFTVRVTARNAFSLQTSTTATVTVSGGPKPRLDIGSAERRHILGDAMTIFGGLSPDPGLTVTYEWNLGDGTTATTPVVRHQYSNTGTYDVTLVATDGVGRVYSRSLPITVVPRTEPPAAVDNSLAPYCAGSLCGASDADTYDGANVGVWRYHNASTTNATIDVSIDGVEEGDAAVLLFSNGSSSAAPAVPSPGTRVTVAGSGRGASAEKTASPVQLQGVDLHLRALRQNIALARQVTRSKPAAATVGTGSARQPRVRQAPAIATQREWNDPIGPGQRMMMEVAATCALPTGRNAVFWLDANQVAARSVSGSRIQFMADALCATNGVYAQMVALLGEVWGPGAPADYIDDPIDAPRDLNVIFPASFVGTETGGFFASANLRLRAFQADSDEALIIYVNPANLIFSSVDVSPGSTMIHELKHAQNFYQRSILRGVGHGPWLEETSAMLAEDILSGLLFGFDRTGARHGGYSDSGGNQSYIGWILGQGAAYNLGGTFAGWLHRHYGFDIDRRLVDSCQDSGTEVESYQCIDAIIKQLGGRGFDDDFARMGATVFGGMDRAGYPPGYGFPSVFREGVFLDSLDTSQNRVPELATAPQPLSGGYLATMHTYQLDFIAAGESVYRRYGVIVPAGTTLLIVIQPPRNLN